MNKKLNNNKDGFTIIEVLIVLAIAGLILLVVFLAVPALQRNSRNTQKRNEVSAALGAVSEYVANNNGRLPTTSGAFNTAFTGSNVNFSAYTPANVTYNYSGTARTGTPATNTNLDTLVVYNYATCTGNTLQYTGTSNRSVAALFAVEGASGPVQQCVAS